MMRENMPVSGGIAGAAPTRRSARPPATCEARPVPRRARGAGRRARQRRNVRAARRHRARHRPRRADRAGAPPAPAALGDRVHRGGLATPRCSGSSTGCAGARAPARAARRAGAGGHRGGDPASSLSCWATTCRPRPCMAPDCGHAAGRGRRGALAGIVSGSGPDVRVPVRRRRRARRGHRAAGRGRVPHGPRGARPGARRPGRRPCTSPLRARRRQPGPRSAPDAPSGEHRQPGSVTRTSRRRCGAARRRVARCRGGERIGVVGSTAVGRPRCSTSSSASCPRRRSGEPGRRPAWRTSRRRQLPPRARARRRARPARHAEHEWAADPQVRASSTGSASRSRSHVEALRRRAAPGRAGRRAVGDLDLLVLDEPTNHLDVEGVGWLAEHLLAAAQRSRRRHPRPLVPRRGLHPHLGGRRRPGRELRGRLRRLGFRPGRAHQAGRRRRGAPAATSPARSWPGCAAGRPPARPSRATGSRPPRR